MKMWKIAACLAACAIAFPAPAGAWDYSGHRIVGDIADIVLQRDHPEVHARVMAMLERKSGASVEKRTLREVAVFPDCAKSEPQFCGRRPSEEEVEYVLRNNGHRNYHFTNSPLQQRRYLAGGAGTGETDIVQMITHTVEQLQGKRPYFKFGVKLEDAEPVWLLAHLVGDVHQPLHVGQAYFDTTCQRIINPNASRTIEAITTLGGNTIKLTGNEASSLHIYWDVNAVGNAMKKEGFDKDERGFAGKLAATPPTDWQSTGAPETWAEQWIEQTMPLAEAAYQLKIEHDPSKDSTPVFPVATINCGLKTTITSEYEAWAAALARTQLQRAGYRLAAILVAALKPH
jgi:hypothetical protein